MYAVVLMTLLAFQAQPAEPSVRLSGDETQLVNSINRYRANHKLPPMQVDATLMKVARHRVVQFNHHAFGCWSWEEAKRSGFQGICTDNLAQGQSSGSEAVEDWGHSDGHAMQMKGYRNMNRQWENCHFDRLGVARCNRNWIAVFGKRSQ